MTTDRLTNEALKNEILYRSNNEEIQLSDSEDFGGWSGYASVKGLLDDKGTLMIDGCYEQTIPDLLTKGFAPDTHAQSTGLVPTLKNTLGMYMNAVEDEHGLFVEGAFYNSHAAQEARSQISQRLGAGKQMGMSIGFSIEDYIRIFPKDFEAALTKYSAPQYLTQNLEHADNFKFIDICTEIAISEASFTVIPANEESLVTEVRTGNYNSNTKNMADEIRVAKKIGQDSHAQLSKHLDKMDECRDKLAGHLDDMDDAHEKACKAMKDLKRAHKECRDQLDALRDGKRDEDKKDDDAKEPDGDEKRMSEIYSLLEEIKNKK